MSGDIFSCHAVDNPKPQEEFAMLKQYGPDVPDSILQKLVAAFGELRNMADQGTITYPYSTREVVNIVKHLQVNIRMSCAQHNHGPPVMELFFDIVFNHEAKLCLKIDCVIL